jgi:hypothetical protein
MPYGGGSSSSIKECRPNPRVLLPRYRLARSRLSGACQNPACPCGAICGYMCSRASGSASGWASYRGRCIVGFHSRASFCASAICAGVISLARRFLNALLMVLSRRNRQACPRVGENYILRHAGGHRRWTRLQAYEAAHYRDTIIFWTASVSQATISRLASPLPFGAGAGALPGS